MSNALKVGILTFTNARNYGAELQAYALAKAVERMGHHVTIINYEKRLPPTTINIYNAIDEGFLRISQGDFQDLIRKFNAYKGKFTKSKVDTFKQKSLPKSSSRDLFNQFEAMTTRTSTKYNKHTLFSDPPVFDAYITGSDQVWNYRRSNDLNSFFLCFAPRDSLKISYAASFGVEAVPIFLRKHYKNWLSQLSFLSVREDSGVRLIHQLTKITAQHVADPTMLFDKVYWADLCLPVATPDRYLLVYTLTLSTNILANARLIAEKLGLNIVAFGSANKKPDNLVGISQPDGVGPREFLHLFLNSQYVITDSFHGTVFSLLFEKQFVYIGDKYNKQISRCRSLLSMLGLLNRIHEDIPLDSQLLYQRISYDAVTFKIEKFRRSSLAFLIDSLS